MWRVVLACVLLLGSQAPTIQGLPYKQQASLMLGPQTSDHIFFSRLRILSGSAGTAGAYGGIAVVDVDDDSKFEVFLNGQHQANQVLKWRTGAAADVASELHLDEIDPSRQGKLGFGVVACDLDGDGLEEIYSISSSQSPGSRPETGFRGSHLFNDRVFKRVASNNDTPSNRSTPRHVEYEDTMWMLNSDTHLKASVVATCADVEGTGVYQIFIGELGGGVRKYDPAAGNFSYILESVPPPPPPSGKTIAHDRGQQRTSAQSFQSFLSGPITTTEHSQVEMLCCNSGGENHVLKCSVEGCVDQQIDDSGSESVLRDPLGLARATAFMDSMHSPGQLDIIIGNAIPTSDFLLDANGNSLIRNTSRHRLFVNQGNGVYVDQTPDALHQSWGRVSGVVVADLDNDGYEEIFLHNTATSVLSQPNVLLKRVMNISDGEVKWQQMNIGDEAADVDGSGSAAAVLDLDGDGVLELILTHDHHKPAPTLVFRSPLAAHNHFLRILPRTRFGAPARGARVMLAEVCGRIQTRIIDAGGASVAHQEPVAHFGLGYQQTVLNVTIVWSDGRMHVLMNPEVNRMYEVDYPAYNSIDSSRGNAFVPPPEVCQRGITRQPLTLIPPPGIPLSSVDLDGNGVGGKKHKKKRKGKGHGSAGAGGDEDESSYFGEDDGADGGGGDYGDESGADAGGSGSGNSGGRGHGRGGTGQAGVVGAGGADGATGAGDVSGAGGADAGVVGAEGSGGSTTGSANGDLDMAGIECYDGIGDMYRGTANVSNGGFACQNWVAVTPNFHTFWPLNFPNSGLDGNLCRNPNGESGPWCFTVDGPRWEFCGVPTCDEIAKQYGPEKADIVRTRAARQACDADEHCASYQVRPCKAEVSCGVGYFFQEVTSNTTSCFCRRGHEITCADNATCPESMAFQQLKQTKDSPDRCFCAQIPESGTDDPFTVAEVEATAVNKTHIGPVRIISLQHRVQFRACLRANVVGPLRCVLMMEALGYSFESSANATLADPGKNTSSAALAASAQGANNNNSSSSSNNNGTTTAGSSSPTSPEGTVQTNEDGTPVDNAERRVIDLSVCPEMSAKSPCDDKHTMTRKFEEGAEKCKCLINSFVVDPCPEAMNCGEGYVLQQTATRCVCLLEAAAKAPSSFDEAGAEGDSTLWHGGCEHCNYGHGTCVFSNTKGWFCKCASPWYTGDDCLQDS